MTPQIIRTRDELAALDPDTLVAIPRDYGDCDQPRLAGWVRTFYPLGESSPVFPAVVVATGAQVRAARQEMEATDDLWDLPSHRTEAGYPNCSTCDGGGCPDCTDPA